MSKTSIWEDVEAFHKAFSHPVEDKPIKLAPLAGYVEINLLSVSAQIGKLIEILADAHRDTKSKDYKLRLLRISLLAEEFSEYLTAEFKDDIVEIADALGDIHYIAAGTELAYGIPGQKVFSEIQRSNMSKLDEDGKPTYREDGKVAKPANWSPPRVVEIIRGEKLCQKQ